MKRLQNRIAESRWTLPVACVYGLLVWLAGGLVSHGLWVTFVCFAVATYLMVELNNRNALLRIYSRMVSVSFIALSMMLPRMMYATRASLAGVCFVMSLFVLLFCYQDRQSVGKTFYTFMILSIGSIFDVHLLYYVPALWLVMAFYLQSMSWRALFASIIGVITPYWFAALLFFLFDNPLVVVSHVSALADVPLSPDYLSMPIGSLVAVAWIVVLVITGTIHFVRNSYMDSIRIRMIFNSFMFLAVYSLLLMAAVPSLFDVFVRVLVVAASPLIAHFISLTRSRVTNIAFVVIVVVTLAITVFNLWTQLSSYL